MIGFERRLRLTAQDPRAAPNLRSADRSAVDPRWGSPSSKSTARNAARKLSPATQTPAPYLQAPRKLPQTSAAKHSVALTSPAIVPAPAALRRGCRTRNSPALSRPASPCCQRLNFSPSEILPSLRHIDCSGHRLGLAESGRGRKSDHV